MEENQDKFLQNLERQRNWNGQQLVKYQGFWFPEFILQAIVSCQRNFKAENSDIILTTMPKSGTTWIKALVFAIVNRRNHPISESHLLTSNPQVLVPCLNFIVYRHEENPNLQHIPSPRIFSTHMSFSVLPASIRESHCKIIYLCRNFLDQFVSYRQFSLSNNFGDDADQQLPLEEAFDLNCRGIQSFGPLWDQMSEYWNAHLQNPEKVLFLKYEDLKEDVSFYVRQIAKFIGLPFSPEEEKQGVVEQISALCSLENLKNLEVNKSASNRMGIAKFSSFFRKGEVGDWKNYLIPAMAERLEKLVESKVQGFPNSKLGIENLAFSTGARNGTGNSGFGGDF